HKTRHSRTEIGTGTEIATATRTGIDKIRPFHVRQGSIPIQTTEQRVASETNDLTGNFFALGDVRTVIVNEAFWLRFGRTGQQKLKSTDPSIPKLRDLVPKLRGIGYPEIQERNLQVKECSPAYRVLSDHTALGVTDDVAVDSARRPDWFSVTGSLNGRINNPAGLRALPLAHSLRPQRTCAAPMEGSAR